MILSSVFIYSQRTVCFEREIKYFISKFLILVTEQTIFQVFTGFKLSSKIVEGFSLINFSEELLKGLCHEINN
jgi:hypothetical protein